VKPTPKQAGGKPESRQEAAKPQAAKPTGKSKGTSRDQALATIRALVEAKKQRARQPPPWPGADPHQHRAHEAQERSAEESARVEEKRAKDDRVEPEQQAQRDKHEAKGVR
jgi:hypothetical protein